jgi:cytochrome bd-type quinol oxidase subunit 2
VATDAAWHFHRVPEPRGKLCLEAFWDGMFCVSSAFLALFFGAALGNVVRGVPLDASGYFFEPLWTNFRLGEETGILDWYTVLVGIVSVLTLTVHGGLWVVLKTEGDVQQRARRAALGLWWGLAAMTAVVTAVTFPSPTAYSFPVELAALGLPFPAAGSRWVLRLHCGHADEHGIRRLSIRVAIELRPGTRHHAL